MSRAKVFTPLGYPLAQGKALHYMTECVMPHITEQSIGVKIQASFSWTFVAHDK